MIGDLNAAEDEYLDTDRIGNKEQWENGSRCGGDTMYKRHEIQ